MEGGEVNVQVSEVQGAKSGMRGGGRSVGGEVNEGGGGLGSAGECG